MRELRVLLMVVAILLAGLVGHGALVSAAAQTPDLDRQIREIASDLRCPVCENLSVADSPSPLAGEMRAVIRQKLQAGEPRQAIMQYFVDRYGEGILLYPPTQGFALLIWIGALASVLLAALLVGSRVRAALGFRRNRAAIGEPALSAAERDHYEALLDAALSRYKQGGP
jgi:cytochrome c-type biogenesis protein CcmH